MRRMDQRLSECVHVHSPSFSVDVNYVCVIDIDIYIIDICIYMICVIYVYKIYL
jgi:hypothetical protein